MQENNVKEILGEIVQNNSNNNDRSHGSRTEHLCRM